MTEDKFIATITYSMLGNSIGAIFEGLSDEEIREKYGEIKSLALFEAVEGTFNYGLSKGGIVDEAYLMLIMAKILTADAVFYPASLVKYMKELRDIPTEFIFEASLNNFIFNIIHQDQVEPSKSESYISLCATVPAVLLKAGDRDNMLALTEQIVTYFNSNEVVKEMAFLFAMLLFNLINQRYDNDTVWDVLISMTNNEKVKSVLERISMLQAERVEDAIREIGNGETVTEVVPLAIWIFAKFFKEPHNALLQAVLGAGPWGGKTDALGFFVGALLGAFHGIIPEFEEEAKKIHFYEEAREYAIDLFYMATHRREKPIRLEVLDNDN